MKKIILALIIFLTVADLSAQDETIYVNLIQPPRFSLNVSSLWRLEFINKNLYNKTCLIRVEGIAKIKGGEKILEGRSSSFTVRFDSPGKQSLAPGDITSVIVENAETATEDYKDFVSRTGSFPPGKYEICVQVINESGNGITFAPVVNVNGYSCYDLDIKNFSDIKLLSQSDGSVVYDTYPVFSWIPPVPILYDVSYTLSIYEVLGRQTPYDATISNREFFVYEGIRTTLFRYPLESRSFVNGRKYAVQIMAYVDNIFISQSGITYFIYRDLKFPEPDTEGKLLKDQNPEFRLRFGGEKSSILQKSNPLIYGLNSNIEFSLGDSMAYSNLAKNFGRLDFVPKLKFNDIPFDVNLFLPSDQTDSAQTMKNISLNLSNDSLDEIMYNRIQNELDAKSDEIEEMISKKGEEYRESIESEETDKIIAGLPERYKTFFAFKKLGLGFNLYPEYSNYTVSGIPVKGINVEYNRNNIYFAFAGPFNFSNIVGTSPRSASYERFLYTGRLGYGMIDNSHLFLTMMYANDKQNTNNAFIDSAVSFTPQNDFLLGAQGNLNLLQENLKLDGEVGISVYSYDASLPAIGNIDETVGMAKTIVNIADIFITPNSSTRGALFYRLNAKYVSNESTTILKAGIKRIDPGYVTLGNPAAAFDNDKMELSFTAEQSFVNNGIIAAATIKRTEDNLGGDYKLFTTKEWLLNFYFYMNYKNFPQLGINYSPSLLKNDANANDIFQKINNSYSNLSVNANFPFNISGLKNNATLLFNWNNSNTYNGFNDNYAWGLNFYDRFEFDSPLRITLNAGYLSAYANILSVTDTITKPFFDENTIIAGIKLGNRFSEFLDYDIGLSYTNTLSSNRKASLYLNLFSRFFDHFKFNATIQGNYFKYKNPLMGDGIFELIFSGIFSYDLN